MKKLNYGYLVVGLLFIMLCIIIILLMNQKYSKENVDNIKSIIHNNNYIIEDYKNNRFILNQSYHKIVEGAEKRKRLAEYKERVDRLREERKAELEKKRLAKQKEEKKVVVSRGNEPSGEWQWFEITFYTAGYESTQKQKGDKGYGITASGTTVKEGRTIACPKSLDFGTKVYIDGFGYRVCEDRGSAITQGHIDVYVDSVDKARQLGRQKLKVKIITK